MNSKPILVQVCHTFLPNVGGIELYAHRIARDTNSKFYSHVITSAKKTSVEKGAYTVHRLKSFNLLPRNPFLCNFPQKIGSLGPDIVHVHSIWFWTSWQAARLKKKMGFKLVNTIHGVWPDKAGVVIRCFLIIFKPIAQYIINRSDKIIVLSESEKNKLIQHFRINSSRIAVIANGIDEVEPDEKSLAEAQQKVGRDYILFTGRIIADKNPDVLVEAFQNLSPEIQKRGLVFIGPVENSYREKLEILGKNQKMTFVESLNLQKTDEQKMMAAYYNLAKVSVAIGSWEGLPTRALESMAQGTPVIAAASGGIGSAIENGFSGFIAPKIDSQTIAGVLQKAFSRDLEKIRKNTLQAVQKFLWKSKFEQIVQLYTEKS